MLFRMKVAHLLVLLFAVMSCKGQSSMFGWIWGKKTDEATVLVADGVPLVSIPYESMTEDEKFLQEAAKFTEIQVSSPLETCQHKVIMKIRTSCSEMTEEELAKLSVNLLNCQSAVEGRKMFPCSEEMSLKQCTTDMDADMWNAYHLMSNRARAVCYATRSTQFRALTELTVNKLMQTAHEQIKTLGSLKESQDRLEEQTVEALSSVSEGNKALLEQQQHLRDAQASAHKLVTTNLKELSSERALIRVGHTQLAAMAEDIKAKLEEASQNLQRQAIERGENHQEVLEDLKYIQEQAELIWDKIESSTNRIFAQHEDALVRYEETLQKLAQINDTIQFIWNVTNAMRAEVDEKLQWLTDYIGYTGEQMQKVYRTGLHVIYLLCAMIFAAFLHAPVLTRLTIMGIVPLNLLSYLKHGTEACLDFTSITALIFLITTMHFLMVGIQRIFAPRKKILQSNPVKIINQNGYTNGTTQNYASSQSSSISLYTKLKRRMQNVYNIILHQMHRCTQTLISLMHSLTSWNRQSLTQHEELSCSYMPTRKSREDTVYNYEREFPSMMSNDASDFENLNATSDRSADDLDNLIDANELRRRLRKIEGSGGRRSYARQQSPSNSVTSSQVGFRTLCRAMTRSGKQCRLLATNDTNFCYRHVSGTSIIED